MRVNLKIILTATALVVAISGFAWADKNFCRGYQLDDVQKVRLEAVGSVDIRQGDENRLYISAEQNADSFIQITYDNDALVIRDTRSESHWHRSTDFWKHIAEPEQAPSKVHYRLELKDPKAISLNGYLVAKVAKIDSEQLDIHFSGSGKLDLRKLSQTYLALNSNGNIQLHAKNVTAENAKLNLTGRNIVNLNDVDFTQLNFQLSGYQECTMQGNSEILSMTMTGKGKCTAPNFLTRHADLGLSGASELVLEVGHQMSATTADESQIRYYGTPKLSNNNANLLKLQQNSPTRMYF